MSQKDKSWKEIPLGGVCWKSSQTYLTGDWKSLAPSLDDKKCTRCLTCAMFCPDSAIHFNEKRNAIEFDLNFCKGCGICANECPAKAITMKIGQ